MANEFKTLPIGTIFTYNGNKYEVCKDDDCYNTCNKCAFNGTNCYTIKGIRGNCIFGHRTDHAQIYYVQINDEPIHKDSDNSSIITPIFNTNNSLNDLHIDCPNGYSIDVEHSDLSKGIIRFKRKWLSLEQLYKLAKDNNYHTYLSEIKDSIGDKTCEIRKKLIALANLMDIASYFNSGWKYDVNQDVICYLISYDRSVKEPYYNIRKNNSITDVYCGNPVFKNEVDAQYVIDNPNFRDVLDTIYKN